MDDSAKTSLLGRTVAHYRISAIIGAGGMGEVYRATDTKLGRDVALKVLPLDMARDPDRLARFQREARAVAALNHPNVVTVYSVEQSNNVHFITMELIEGQSLERLISSNGLPADRIIELAGAIAEALAAAHEKGIVHRDLKPANVMVTNEGRVKVLDFGLAKDINADIAKDATLTSAGHTQSGMVMGTPAYMSPEQVSGRPLDHRSDIFSFGVVLHEMATGSRPFDGHSSAELISSILRDTPPTVTDVRPELPSDLARVIRRCLEKDPRYRVQTARDVSNEFRDLARASARLSSVPTSTPRIIAAADSSGARADEGFWVAVLPFKYSGNHQDLAALAEGLTDDIVTNMSKFSYLRVIARSSTARYAQQTVDVRTAAKELGARYVMEGSIRQAGTKVRIAVQLVDASTGASLWAETYDRVFTPESMLEVFDDVVPRIVATVGDTQGILPHSMTDALRNRDPESLTPYEALLRSFGFHQHVSASEHLAGITALERVVKQAPDRAECWAMLSWLYRAEYTHGYNVRPDAMDRALGAARRAVSLASSSQLAHAALASAFFFRRELGAFRVAAERALALNSMEGYISAFLGMHFAYAGDWEHGCALSERSTQLNPHHPGWYWSAMVFNAYRQRDSQRALELALRINMPDLWTAQLALTVIYSQLGEMEHARAALAGLLALRPDFAVIARTELDKWWLPDMVEQMLSDLRNAGLEITTAVQPVSSSGAVLVRTASGGTRAEEGFWVAVLPLKYTGSNADLKSLAEGITEEVITGLSRFSYLRVIARGSTAKYAGESGDIRVIGRQLGAHYVMEGSVRQAGSAIRVAVQLLDATTGAHLWAENYERTFNPDALFSLQDDVVPRIVSTVADMNGTLPRSMSARVRGRTPEQLTAYEGVLRSFAYFEGYAPEDLAQARIALEAAVKKTPCYPEALAMLALLHVQDYAQGFELQPDALASGAAVARRAVEAAPSSHLAHFALAQAHFFQKEFPSFRNAAERTVVLNPMDGNALALLGELLIYVGEAERGMELAGRAKRLNPHHPGWYWHADFNYAYRKRNYRGAVEAALKSNLPGDWGTQVLLAAGYAQLGATQEASKALRELVILRPDISSTVRRGVAKWFDPEHGAHLLEGLSKAGLEIKEDQKAVSTAAPSIAVLPFTNLSADPEQDYFSDGLAEEIINLLARVPGLKVIARTSAFAFRGKEQDIRGIAGALGVSTILEGSVRRSGNRIRATAQLINAADGSHLWSERYDRELSDIFAVQDEVSEAIGKALRVKLSREASQRYMPKLEAYEAYLKGRYLQAKVTPESMELARRFYEQASELDPGFGMAHVGLGYYWVSLAHFGRHSVHECVPAVRAEARRALQIDPSLADAHALLGYVAAMYDMDWAAAEQHFDFPMAKQASFETIRPLYSGVQFLRGNVEQAIKLAQRAIEEDPLEVWAHMNLHAYLQAAGRDDEALEQLKKVVELDQNQVVALVSMAMIYADKGDLAEALQIARQAYAIGSWFPDTIGVLAALTHRNGEEVESKSLAKALGSGEALGDARAHALFHLLCGEIDPGADWTEKAIEQRDPSMMFYLRFVVCKGLRASRHWPRIANMINLPV
ncbi:MAG TPA: protein kinase [Terriglobales bacterium]|nr:protein kinase [Terriglobales bacterium]